MNMPFDSDRGGRARWVEWLRLRMAEALRVARPGAHALIWALPRRSHWTALALDDAGWIIEDRIAAITGQGFPKHKYKLKPAIEDWWLCTKPGGAKWLGVESCRVGVGEGRTREGEASAETRYADRGGTNFAPTPGIRGGDPAGRWPTNLALIHHADCRPVGTKRVKSNGRLNCEGNVYPSHNKIYGPYESGTFRTQIEPDGMETVEEWLCVEQCPIRLLDEQAGERKSGLLTPDHRRHSAKGWSGPFADDNGGPAARSSFGGDSGPVSRYFPQFSWQDADFVPWLYCAKAPPSQRGDDNTHPTLKNIDLMRWLCRLVCPPGGVVLDNFMGSGTTGKACILEGFRFIGIESDPDYFAMAERGIGGTRLDAERPHRPKPKPSRRKQAESLPLFDGLDPS